MLKNNTYCILIMLLLSMVPGSVAAQPLPPGGPGNPPVGGGPNPGSDGLTNPLGNFETLAGVLGNVVNFLLGLAGVLALLALVWGGIRYITALGNESSATEAKKIITWAIIGLLVVGGSYAIINTVVTSILKAN